MIVDVLPSTGIPCFEESQRPPPTLASRSPRVLRGGPARSAAGGSAGLPRVDPATADLPAGILLSTNGCGPKTVGKLLECTLVSTWFKGIKSGKRPPHRVFEKSQQVDRPQSLNFSVDFL